MAFVPLLSDSPQLLVQPTTPPANNCALIAHQTTNKVQKTLQLIAQATGGLSIAMPLTLLVSFAGGASAGLTGSAALAALCLTVIKALGFATIAALGTVGTFGLMCAIPVVISGLSLLILHLYNSKKALDESKQANFDCEPIPDGATPPKCIFYSNLAILDNVLSSPEIKNPLDSSHIPDAQASSTIDELKQAALNSRPTLDDKTPPTLFDVRDTQVMDKQWARHARAISTIVASWMKPSISLPPNFQEYLINYLTRFSSDLQEPTLTAAFIYLEKLVTLKKIHIDLSNIGKYIPVCLCLADKYHHDEPKTTTLFVKKTKINKKEFNELERKIFAHLGHNMTVTPKEFATAQGKFNALLE